MRSYGKLAAGLLAAWFIFAVAAAALHLFENGSNRIGVAVGVTAAAPILIYALWYAVSGGFRAFILSLNARTLTYVQSWRLAGFVFVVLQSYGILPSVFALPAGYGDMAIGATASLVAWKLADAAHRQSFIVWQALGMADLLMAVSLGTAARVLSPQGVSMHPMTVLPLSVVPTFIVPLLFILHLICIAQARHWKTAPADGHRTAPSFSGWVGEVR